MKSTPCEFLKWNGLPVIRREIVESMILKYGLTQKDAAIKLGVTPAAVCQYVSKKRGKVKIIDQDILQEIDKSAKIIIDNGSDSTVKEICRICKIMKQEGLFHFFCNSCND